MSKMSRVFAGYVIAVIVSSARVSEASDEAPSTRPPAPAQVAVPFTAYAVSAFGAPSLSLGAVATGEATGLKSSSPVGGALTVFGSPVDRLTLWLSAERRTDGRAAPSASVSLRIAGGLDEGWAIAAQGRFKSEGFAEVEGEVEVGVLASYRKRGVYFDGNVVGGRGFDDSETDTEVKLRGGYELNEWFRIGLDGRARLRVGGDRGLVGDRKYDVIGGPQIAVGSNTFFGAVTGGPSTVGVASGVGWSVIVTAGGIAW